MIALREAVRRVLGGSPSAAPASDTRISWETVESVTGLNDCVVLGQTLPVTGLATFPVGARVPVAWRNGTPLAVIGHRTRRAQFHPSRRVGTKGIVEELLVGNFDNTSAGIWYRTHDRLEPITDSTGRPLTAFPQGSMPQVVQWGLDGKSFGVQCSGGVYAVSALSRDDPNTAEVSAPRPAAPTPGAEAPGEEPAAAGEPERGPQTGRAVLFVDDEEALRAIVHELLVRAGHDVVTAEDTDEALAQLAARRFDAVIADLMMPGAGGEAVLAAARELDPPPPVIVVTGKAEDGLFTRLQAAGAAACFSKPFALQDLLDTLERLMEA